MKKNLPVMLICLAPFLALTLVGCVGQRTVGESAEGQGQYRGKSRAHSPTPGTMGETGETPR